MRVALLALFVAETAAAHGAGVAVLELRRTSAATALLRWTLPPGSPAPGVSLPSTCDLSEARLTCVPGLAGATLAFTGLDGAVASVLVRILDAEGAATTLVADARSPRIELPAATETTAPLARYLRLGVAHILSGFDHLLLVLGLVLLCRGRRLVLAVSAFTGGHSLTLALAALGVVHFPVRAAEVVIALSLVVLAVELTRDPTAPPTLTRRRPGLVAAAFGLVHGLGFAGALAEVGLPPGDVVPALLGFNLGVEVGQLAVVGALVAALALVRVRPIVPAYAMGTLAVAWTLERLVTLGGSP